MIEPSSPNPENPAIERCMTAWQTAYRAAIAKEKDKYSAAHQAALAYRNSMPSLYGDQDVISCFIACVAQGMLIGAIEGKNGTNLLYAARVALGALRRQPTPRKVA